jgi:hypothetical protein
MDNERKGAGVANEHSVLSNNLPGFGLSDMSRCRGRQVSFASEPSRRDDHAHHLLYTEQAIKPN